MRWAVVAVAAAGSIIGGCSRPGVAPFGELDRNGDGRISQEEAAHDLVLAEIFADFDADKDGELTALEYLQAANRR